MKRAGVELNPWELGVNIVQAGRGRIRIDFADGKPEVWRLLREGEELDEEWIVWHGFTYVPLMVVVEC